MRGPCESKGWSDESRQEVPCVRTGWHRTHDSGDGYQWRDITRREERALARNFTHRQRPWDDCNKISRRVCLRCYWWRLTGEHERRKEAHVAQVREWSKNAPRQTWRKDPETGRYVRVE